MGGGRIRVTEIDGVPADFGGDSNTLIIHNEDTPAASPRSRPVAGPAPHQYRVHAGVPRRDGRLRRYGAGMRLPHPPRAGTADGRDAGHPEVTCLNIDEPGRM
ncbi:MAG: hypothetical protein ACLVJH_01880 [Faecalibacterium prausnitzii]